jgi:hypothetical protein
VWNVSFRARSALALSRLVGQSASMAIIVRFVLKAGVTLLFLAGGLRLCSDVLNLKQRLEEMAVFASVNSLLDPVMIISGLAVIASALYFAVTENWIGKVRSQMQPTLRGKLDQDFDHAPDRWVRVDEIMQHAAGYSNRGEQGAPLKTAIKDGFRGAAFRGRFEVRGQLVLSERATTGILVDIPCGYWETHELDDNALRLVLANKWETQGVVYPETRHLTCAPDAMLYTHLIVPLNEVLKIWPIAKNGGPLDRTSGAV